MEKSPSSCSDPAELLHSLKTKADPVYKRNREGASSFGIQVPHNHDVLAGRGKCINHHPGNKYFISLIKPLKTEYVATPKQEKSVFARLVIQKIKNLNPPGRFLKQSPETGLWYNIGDKRAILKTRQALREGAPDIEKQLKTGLIMATMKDTLDADLVRRVLDSIEPPSQTPNSATHPIDQRNKRKNSPTLSDEETEHVIDTFSFEKKFSNNSLPDDAVQVLMKMATSQQKKAKTIDHRNAAGVDMSGEGVTKESQNKNYVPQDVIVLDSSDSEDKSDESEPSALEKAILSASVSNPTTNRNRRVSFKSTNQSNKSNSFTHLNHQNDDVPSRRDSAVSAAIKVAAQKLASAEYLNNSNRRVSFCDQRDLHSARRASASSIPTNIIINKNQEAYEAFETLDDGVHSHRPSFRVQQDLENTVRRSSIVSQLSIAPQTIPQQNNITMMNPSNRRVSYKGQDRDIERAIESARRTSFSSQIVAGGLANRRVSYRGQQEIDIEQAIECARRSSVSSQSVMIAPQSFTNESLGIGSNMNRRVSFQSTQDLNSRRPSVASQNVVLLKPQLPTLCNTGRRISIQSKDAGMMLSGSQNTVFVNPSQLEENQAISLADQRLNGINYIGQRHVGQNSSNQVLNMMNRVSDGRRVSATSQRLGMSSVFNGENNKNNFSSIASKAINEVLGRRQGIPNVPKYENLNSQFGGNSRGNLGVVRRSSVNSKLLQQPPQQMIPGRYLVSNGKNLTHPNHQSLRVFLNKDQNQNGNVQHLSRGGIFHVQNKFMSL